MVKVHKRSCLSDLAVLAVDSGVGSKRVTINGKTKNESIVNVLTITIILILFTKTGYRRGEHLKRR